MLMRRASVERVGVGRWVARRARCLTTAAGPGVLTHYDAETNRPKMVDVGAKAVTDRRAVACGDVRLPDEVWAVLRGSGFHAPKGPVFATATVAGVQGAKRTAELIPFCHAVALDDCQISFDTTREPLLRIECSVRCHNRTGVEMEALTGVVTAALTVHDMCKAIDPRIRIENIRLVAKSGGKTPFDIRDDDDDDGDDEDDAASPS